jgi:hypothetical protein
MQSVEAHSARGRRGLLWDRLRYHESMIMAARKNAEVIVERHRAEAERCAELLGISTTEGEAA